MTALVGFGVYYNRPMSRARARGIIRQHDPVLGVRLDRFDAVEPCRHPVEVSCFGDAQTYCVCGEAWDEGAHAEDRPAASP